MVFSFLLLVQRLCATLGLSQPGPLPCPAWSVRRQPPRVLTNTEPFLDHFRTIGSRDLLHWLNSDGSSILEVRETTPPHGGDNSMCRHLALHSATKVPLTPYLEQSTGNSNGLFHRLRAPNPLLPLVPVLGGGPHTPSRAHCQGTPVLPTPPSTISRHRSARGWPA